MEGAAERLLEYVIVCTDMYVRDLIVGLFD